MQAVSESYIPVMKRFILADMRSIRLTLLCLAILIYGAFGSPTPDDPGVLEVVIAALLAVSIGISGVWNALQLHGNGALWEKAGRLFLIFALSVPLLAGLYGGNDLGLALRDIAAFLFMMLPLLVMPLLKERPEGAKALLYTVLALGVLFALRAGSLDLSFLGGSDELYYLANMPSVLFAALFFGGYAITIFVGEFTPRALLKAAVFAGLSVLCLLPVIETQQRASVGVFVLSMVVLMLFYFWRQPKRTFLLMAVLAVVSIPFWNDFAQVQETLSRKTALVGGNMRAAEWQAVWDAISAHSLSVFKGLGWGATFSSPAVADIEVNFTHGLLSSLLLKTGLAGLALGVLYLGTLARLCLKLWPVHPVLMLALAWPIAIDVFLYASFKSLDFGLVLLLIPALIFYGDGLRRSVASEGALLYSKDCSQR